MARKRKKLNKSGSLKPKVSKEEEMEIPDPESREFFYTETDEFHNAKEKILLGDSGSDALSSDREEEVYAMEEESEDTEVSDEDSMETSSEVEPERDEERNSWGSKKHSYYHGDEVTKVIMKKTKTYQVVDEEEEEMVRLEEEEATRLQKNLINEIGADDFELDYFHSEAAFEEAIDATDAVDISNDLSEMSDLQKLRLISKDSPELVALTNDYSVRLSSLLTTFYPAVLLIRRHRIRNPVIISYCETCLKLYLTYLTNISVYFSLKSLRVSTVAHPIVDRLASLRDSINVLDRVGEGINGKITDILGREAVGSSPSSQLEVEEEEENIPKSADNVVDEVDGDVIEFLNKHLKKQSLKIRNRVLSKTKDVNEFEDEEVDVVDSKRSITYTMAKNKGLTPKRKKELRNPRVKHRMKARRTLIRRKGQVRDVVKELARYGGEMTGIKIGLKKGIKIL